MKKKITKKSASKLLESHPIKSKIEGWYFRIEETSNGAWGVEGQNQWGNKVYSQGGDPELLLEELETKASRINQKSNYSE